MADVTIAIRNNGPYLVTGSVNLTDADGKPGRENVVRAGSLAEA